MPRWGVSDFFSACFPSLKPGAIKRSRLSQKTYGLFRQPIIFFSASFLRKKQSFFLKNDALKEFLWAAHNDEGVMRQPRFLFQLVSSYWKAEPGSSFFTPDSHE
jgi:hypothetical protein